MKPNLQTLKPALTKSCTLEHANISGGDPMCLKALERLAANQIMLETYIEVTLSTEGFDVKKFIENFSAKLLDFLSQIGSTSKKLSDQLGTYGNVSTQQSPDKILSKKVYGYPADRYDDLVSKYVRAAKDVRAVVRALSKGKLDNAAKLANRVAKYTGKRNDVFRLKKDPTAVRRSKETLTDHGFNLTKMVQHTNSIKEMLNGRVLESLRKNVEASLAKANEKDAWLKVASRFAAQSINELAEITIELAIQQISMLKAFEK